MNIKDFITLRNCRTLATLLLAICFVLPLSQCQTASKHGSPPSPPIDHYAYQDLAHIGGAEDFLGAANTLLIFFFPLTVLRVKSKYSGIATIPIGLWSLYILWVWIHLGTPRYGGILAIGAWLVLLMCSVMELIQAIRAKRKLQSEFGSIKTE